MNNEPAFAELDAAIASVGFPVRGEVMERAWNLVPEAPVSDAFHQRVQRAIGRSLHAGELLLLITLRARPGREAELADASKAFVRASRELPGLLGSNLYRSAADPLTFTLAERFLDRQVLERHMAADYFRRFQIVQGPLLAAPVEALFFPRATG